MIIDEYANSATHGESHRPTTGRPAAAAEVPIAIWWLNSITSDVRAPSTAQQFASRLARRLILTYSKRDDAVIDLDGDDVVSDAARYCSREYLALDDAANIARLDQLSGPAALVSFRWPRGRGAVSSISVDDLLLACRYILAPDAGVLAVVTKSADELHVVGPPPVAQSAMAAGLHHRLSILAVPSRERGDRFLYYTNHVDAFELIVAGPRDVDQLPARIDVFSAGEIVSRDV